MNHGWTLKIDRDYPGTLLPYRAHLWNPEGRFSGEQYTMTKFGARLWGRREVRRQTHPGYSIRTEVKL